MDMTFKEVALMYLEQPTKSGKHQAKTLRVQEFVGEMIDRWGDLPIKNFQQKALGAVFISELRKRPCKNRAGVLSNGSVNQRIVYLRAVLHYACKEEFIERVPTYSCYPEGKRELFLTPKQARELIRWLDPLRADMAEFCLNTGFRVSNICNLRWDQLSDDFKTVYVKAKKTKNGEATSFPMNRDAQRILRRYKEKRDDLIRDYTWIKNRGVEHVFIQDEVRSEKLLGTPLRQTSVTNLTWKNAVKNANLPEETVFHSLRHTFASWHIMSGTGETTLMQLGGWKNATSMQRYMHLNHEHKAKAASAMEGMLRSR